MKYPKLILALSILLLSTVAAFATTISGTTSVCTGRTTSLSIDTSGGTWSSANTARATVNPTTGLVSGVAAGTVLISYNLPAATFTAVVSVITSPIAISGLSAICEGTTTTLTNPMGSGTWSSADPSVATIGLGSGLLTAVDAGTVIITYTQYTGCFNTRVQTINVAPAAISGGPAACVGTATTLSSAPAGGTWTSSSISVATIGSASGILNGVAGGGTTISYSLPTGCRRTIAFSVVNLPAAISGSLLTCVGNTTTLTSTTGGGTWASSNPTVASVGTGAGVVTAVSAGTAIITYTVGTGCRRTAIVTVNAGISAIAGEPTICLGSTSALTNATGGGTWSSNSTPKATVHISTGIVTPVSAGTAIISYKTGAACYSTLQVTVSSALAAITGTTGFCTGTTTTLSHPIAGGTWSSSNTAKATVGISSGVVTGVSSGTATITYTLSSGCRKTINVLVNATIPAIGGATAVCQAANTTLTNSSGGGTWTSTNTTVATIISSSGIMTGISAGTTTISYLVASGCYATRIMTVHATPAAISGSALICTGSTAPFTTTPSGGTWYSSSVSVATVGAASGIVTAITGGGTTISYVLPTGCRATKAVTVSAAPAAITGTATVNIAATTTFSSATPGGSWTSSNTGVATIGSSSGIVTGISAGTTVITYAMGASCYTTRIVTVSTACSISGTLTLCTGNTTTLTATGGGTWTSTVPSVATIGISSGIVSALASGTTTVAYTTAGGCTSSAVVTVYAMPASITGTTALCTGAATTLANSVSGGTWTSVTTAVATIGAATGIVAGLTAGTTTISYTTGTGCATTTIVTVSATPAAITGTATTCVGATTTLANATAGGTWTSVSTSVATIGISSGIVSALAPGTTTIAYTTGSGCTTSTIVTVYAMPASITGTTALCTGAATTLANSVSGGTWTSVTTAVATIGAATGIVAGLTAGTTTISYTTGTGCARTTVVTVSATPAAITGTATTCVGATTTLANATAGGTWTSVAASVATIGSATGVATGIAAGTSMISYILPSGCYTTRVQTINSSPAAITGTTTLNEAATTTLENATSGGTWTSSSVSVATVGSATGIVAGISAGTAIISYSLSSGCYATTTVTVLAVCNISGTLAICETATTTLSTVSGGGTWTSVSTAVATIGSASGIVTGVASGTTTISYNSGTGCISTAIVTVTATPAAITGTATTCTGTTTTLESATAGGTWISASTSFATIGSATGIATAIAAGTSTISYILPAGCYTTRVQTINSSPATITGTTTVNEAATTTLENATAGGTWTSSNTSVATVGSATGIVAGITAGTAVISYTLSSGCYVTTTVTVLAVCTISGTLAICPAATTTLSTVSGGGTWTSVSTAVATIGSASGIVTAVAAGATTISYNSGTGCISIVTLTVNSNPAAIAGPAVLCAATTATQTNTTGGGTWTSAAPEIATIGSASGIATAVAAGTTTISYILTPSGCYTTRTLTINEATGATISGSSVVCIGRTTTLSPSVSGGTWASSTPSKAAVNSTTGVVTGVSAGTTLISYTSGGCVSTITMTIYANPATVTGTNSVNIGSTTTFSSATSGGTWSSSNTAVGTVGTSGIITGISAGTATITYTIPATTCFLTRNVTVINPCAMTGSLLSCIDFSSALASPISGGTWTSTNTTVATVGSSTGVLTGLTTGTTTISYTTGGGCLSVRIATVNSSPAPVAGAPTVCVDAATILTGTPAGGTWSSSNTAVGSVNSATRTVYGISAGIVTMSYVLSASCYTTHSMTVNPSAGTISGAAGMCLGSTITLTSDSTGGIWTSSSPAIASVGSATGIVSSVSIGAVTLSYAVPAGCFSTWVVNSDTLPVLTTITYGSSTVEIGKSIFLTNCYEEPGEGVDLPYGGYWASSDTSIGTFSSPWYPSEMAAVATGTVTAMYILKNGCGADTANKIVTVVTPTCPKVWEYSGGGENADADYYSPFTSTLAKIAVGRDGNPVVCTAEGYYLYARKFVDGKFEPLRDSADLRLGMMSSSTSMHSVAIDDSGYTYVTYDDAYTGMISIKKHDGNKWVYVGSPIAGYYSSLIIAANGDFYIRYLTTGGIQVMKFNGTDWISLGATGLLHSTSYYSGFNAHGFDVAGDGAPFISGFSGDDQYSIKKFSGGVWTTVGTGSIYDDYASKLSSFALDPSGILHFNTGTSIAKIVDGVHYDLGTAGLDPGFLNAYCMLKFDKNGILYVLSTATAHGRMAKYDGSTWSYIGGPITKHVIYGYSEGYSVDASLSVKFSLDYSGKPYITTTETNYSYVHITTIYAFDGAGWKSIAANDRISNGAASRIVLSMIMKGDTPIVACADAFTNFKAVVKKQVGNTWEYVGTPGFSALDVYEISLAKDTGDALYVAYTEGYWQKLTVKKFSSGDWVTVGSESFAEDVESIDIAVANNGIPYVSYRAGGNATVLKYNGTSWVAAADAAVSSEHVSSVSMDISSTGIPYVAYLVGDDILDYESILHVVKLNGSVWEVVGSPIGESLSPYIYISPDIIKIKLDNSDIPYILYTTDYFGGGEFRVKKFDGTNWAPFGSPYIGLSQNTISAFVKAEKASICFDNTNVAYVAYGQTGEYGYGIDITHVSKHDGIDWIEVGRPIHVRTENMAIAVSGSGIPYLAHIGGSLDEEYLAYDYLGLTVLKLADNRIKGNLNTCPGYVSDLFTADTAAGTWSSSNTAVASINAFGLVTGIAPGTTTISYDASGCIITAVVTVNEAPAAGTLSGTTTVAESGTTTFASTITGGVWSTGNPAVATVGASSGVVTGVATGTATITYAHVNSCGLAIATRTVNVTAARPGTTAGGQSVFMVYPNPTSGSLSVESAIEGTVKVSTIDGREIKEYKISKGSTQLALPAELSAGIYMFRFAGNDGTSNIVRLVYEPQ